MTDERKPDELTEEEVAKANGEQLPDREVMTVLHPPLPMAETPFVYGTDPPVSDA